jgi:hypothetical protein
MKASDDLLGFEETCHQTKNMITERRRPRPRRGLVPQAKSAQQRLKKASAPQRYGFVSSSSKEYGREGNLASVQMVILTLLFYSTAKRSPLAAAAQRRCRKRLGTGLGTTIEFVRNTASGAAGGILGATIKYLRRTRNGAADNGLGTTIKSTCDKQLPRTTVWPPILSAVPSVYAWSPSSRLVFIKKSTQEWLPPRRACIYYSLRYHQLLY